MKNAFAPAAILAANAPAEVFIALGHVAFPFVLEAMETPVKALVVRVPLAYADDVRLKIRDLTGWPPLAALECFAATDGSQAQNDTATRVLARLEAIAPAVPVVAELIFASTVQNLWKLYCLPVQAATCRRLVIHHAREILC